MTVIIGTGVVVDDFNQILSDFARSVSYSVNTKSIDPISGSETSTFAAPGNVSLIYFKQDCRWIWEKYGLVQVADAYIIAPTTLGIKRYDQFTVDGLTYYIEEVIRRHVTSVAMQDFATCFLVTNV